MKNTNKKGFTIVELVIVIAVIAILAAVLIPTFASIVKKANISKDTQLIRNLNTALVSDTDAEFITMADALAAAEEFGYDLEKINASATNNEILWDSKNNVFCYLNDGVIEYIPESVEAGEKASGAELWVISDTVSETYSTYLVNYEGESVEAKHSLDVSACGAVDVVYKGSASVVIKTNGGSLKVENSEATVAHYGTAYILDVANPEKFTGNGSYATKADDITEADDTYTGVATEAELAAALEAGTAKIKLTADIVVNNDEYCKENDANKVVADKPYDFVVPAGKTIELNLNGFDIVATHSSEFNSPNVNNGVFDVKGNLTITGSGTIELTHDAANMAWNAASAVISVNQGTLTLSNGVKILNNGGTDMAYGVDVLTNGSLGDATLVVNGAYIETPYRAIRAFCNSTINTAYITINGGVVRSNGNNAIWMQDSNASKNIGVLTIKGGVIESTNTSKPIYIGANAEFDITTNITGGTFKSNGSAVTGEDIYRR